MDTSTLNDLLDSDFEGIFSSDDSESWSPQLPPSPLSLRAVQKALKAESPAANAWDPRMILDLAIGVDGLGEILERYDITPAEYDILSSVPTFRRELAMTMRDVRENGVLFAAKAKVLAESYLTDIDEMIQDDKTPASTRLNAIQSVVRWGKLEPTKDTGTDTSSTGQINIQINF